MHHTFELSDDGTMPNNNHEDDVIPPWLLFPEITPDDVTAHMRQGRAETYFDEHLRPFWSSLSEQGQHAYLDRWEASSAWRDAMLNIEPEIDFDLEEDARESEAYAERRCEREETLQKLPLWKRWFTRR